MFEEKLKGKAGRKPLSEAEKKKRESIKELEKAKKKKSRQLVNDITKVQSKKSKEKEHAIALLPALKINRLLTKQTGRIFNNENIKFAIAGKDGKHTIYIIRSASQLAKAYKLYSELAREHDINVKKYDTITEF